MKALEMALSQLGTKEIVGKQDNPEVLKYFNETGFDGSKLKDETAWCAAFVNWCCKEVGLPYSDKLTARSWLTIGNQTSQPKLGDVAVFWRVSPDSWQGHVGFYIREKDGWIYVLGGNQSNQVSIKAYPKSRLLQYRELC